MFILFYELLLLSVYKGQYPVAAGSLWIQFSDAKNHLAYRTMPVLISPPPHSCPLIFYDILPLINVVIIVFALT
jgi:hypothetical protein